MKDCIKIVFASAFVCAIMPGCQDFPDESKKDESSFVRLEEVAEILAMIPIDRNHMYEVHHAVSSSSGNGYDEEYTMKNLFISPGSGVGDSPTRGQTDYPEPLRDLIEDYVYSTKSAAQMDPDEFISALAESDIQIYWPFSENWDGETMPVVTFDPEDGSDVNTGYRLKVDDDGFRHVEEVVVDEEMAAQVPVWVVNRNSDADYATIEMLRREDPDWGTGGGNIIVRPREAVRTRSEGSCKTLVLRDFQMNRNFDTWFAGASEFFVLTITGGCSFA